MVQRCIDTAAGSGTTLAIIPAGTANLLATNLGIPKDIEQAVEIGLSGERRRLDVGRMNGERFAVMAGAGFDARMIGDADGTLKDRFGRLAYIWTGAKHLRDKPFRAKIAVDGSRWYDGQASCILFGNVGKLFGDVEAFEDARPDDGVLELGVVSADGTRQWVQTIARTVVGSASSSPQTRTTKVHSVRIKLDKKIPYELDGGDRKKVRKLRVDIEPSRGRGLRAGADAGVEAEPAEKRNPRRAGTRRANAAGSAGHVPRVVNVTGFRDHRVRRKPGARQSETRGDRFWPVESGARSKHQPESPDEAAGMLIEASKVAPARDGARDREPREPR